MIDFIIIGTAKSKENSLYYRKERLKVWGIIYLAGFTDKYWSSLEEYHEFGNRNFARKNSFDFFDIMPQYEANDKVMLDQLKSSKLDDLNRIKESVEIVNSGEAHHLLFNGKTSFYLFTYFMLGAYAHGNSFNQHKKEIAKVFMQKGYTYGLLDMSMIPSLPNNIQLKKNYYILPNTSSRTKQEFDEFIWIDTIKKIKESTKR